MFDEARALLFLFATIALSIMFAAGLGAFARETNWELDPRKLLSLAAQTTGLATYCCIVGVFLALSFGHWRTVPLFVATLTGVVVATYWESFSVPAISSLARVAVFQTGVRFPDPSQLDPKAALLAFFATTICLTIRGILLKTMRTPVARLRRLRALIKKRQPYRLERWRRTHAPTN
ncbi:MAG: hypothetical protein AAF235_00920 [Planctomycetota bacterium]